MKWTNSYRSFGLKTKRSTGLKTIEHKQTRCPTLQADEISGASRYERSGDRKAYRAGRYRRGLTAKAERVAMEMEGRRLGADARCLREA